MKFGKLILASVNPNFGDGAYINYKRLKKQIQAVLDGAPHQSFTDVVLEEVEKTHKKTTDLVEALSLRAEAIFSGREGGGGKPALVALLVTLTEIEMLCNLNFTAVVKIVKKFNKLVPNGPHQTVSEKCMVAVLSSAACNPFCPTMRLNLIEKLS